MTVRERSLLRDMVVRAQLANDPHLQQKRRCAVCCQWKPETEAWFTLRLRHDRPNHWLDTTCRKCRNKERQAYREANREREREWDRKRGEYKRNWKRRQRLSDQQTASGPPRRMAA